MNVVLDAYHHVEWPKQMLDAMKHLRLDLDGVIKEIEAHGWDHVETRKFLDYQYFAVFTPR